MSFRFRIPITAADPLVFNVEEGETLFVLGPNGAGKSTLMHGLYRSNQQKARRITAHRQTWFTSNTIDLSPQSKRNTESSILQNDQHDRARWMEDYPSQRASIAIFDLIDAENVRARAITQAVDQHDADLALTLAKKDAPIKIINELLRLSNIPIQISIQETDSVMASKRGSKPYSIAELSDGERNALLLAANILTAKTGTLILIDEPERHLHRSIIAALLTNLFSKRKDCAFVISTHDVALPLDTPGARVLLVRGCTYNGQVVQSFEADLVGPEADIEEGVRSDILGARRRILFVEGSDHSIDKALYSVLFPDVSVVAKSNCREVEQTVISIRDSAGLHWLRAFGIIDNDGRTDTERLKEKGVYALSCFSVESIYYHPEVQRRVSERHANITGENARERLTNANTAALNAIAQHAQRLSERVAEKRIRESVLKNLPKRGDIASGAAFSIPVDPTSFVTAERNYFEKLVREGNLSELIRRYPIRETSALAEISQKLGFQDREQYEGAVRKLLLDDNEALNLVREWFGTLPADIGR